MLNVVSADLAAISPTAGASEIRFYHPRFMFASYHEVSAVSPGIALVWALDSFLSN